MIDLRVRVTAGAKKDSVTEAKGGVLHIQVRAPAKGGQANTGIREILARRFAVSLKDVIIVTGVRSSKKRIRIWQK